jgi:catechol 2,3-dioxygenase-like lactoylglutathione lyase family enzyme
MARSVDAWGGIGVWVNNLPRLSRENRLESRRDRYDSVPEPSYRLGSPVRTTVFIGTLIEPHTMLAPMPPTARKSQAVEPKPFFSSVAVLVSDRRRSVAWYTTRLGLEVIESDDHWVTVGRGGTNGAIHLCQFSDLPDLALEPGETGIDLQLAGDFEELCGTLAARGVAFSRPATHRSWGWYAKIVDPDGNELRLTPAQPREATGGAIRRPASPSVAGPRRRRAAK